MLLLDLIQIVLNLDAQTAATSCPDIAFQGKNLPGCPGSAVTAIAASYGTQGMWVMADLIDQLVYTSLGALGPLIYIVAAAGGMISLAMGSPPRTYLWFFLGPAIYRWLIGTTVPVLGMAWQVAGSDVNQAEVWKLSEVGLVNTAMAWKGLRNPDGSRGGPNQIKFYNNQAPSHEIQVPYFFAFYDSVISGTIQGLVRWTGMYSQRASTAGDDRLSNLPEALPAVANANDRWFLLSNRKWGMIQNITDSRVQNPYLKTMLTRFFACECGEKFAQAVDPTAFVNAAYAKGESVPYSVFPADFVGPPAPGTDPLSNENYTAAFNALEKVNIPMPREVRKLLSDGRGAFLKSLDWGGQPTPEVTPPDLARFANSPVINCRNYLMFIVSAFRWESGQIYNQFMKLAPPGMSPQHLAYNLLYGWNVRKTGPNGDKHLTPEEQEHFIKDLIFVHLVRNEMALARPALAQSQLHPNIISTRMSSDGAEGHLRFIAIKNKSSEFYQWALMIPHMQGILLYYLAVGYPFACLMMIMPGMHKTLFTWMSFWAWAKLWDLGFAMVMALERSVWAMLGSNSNISKALGSIANMQSWGTLKVDTANNVGAIAQVTQQVGDTNTVFNLLNENHMAPLMRLFDRAITVGANLDLDLQNSYYVYIMAGLYFAVPVVAGQLVLGAKAGSASLVNNVIGGVGQEAGRQAAAGYTGDLQTRIKTGQAAGYQEAKRASLRSGSGASTFQRMMDAQNNAALGNLNEHGYGQESSFAKTDAEQTVLSGQSLGTAVDRSYGGLHKGTQGAIGMAKAAAPGLFSKPSGGGAGGSGGSSPTVLGRAVDSADGFQTALGGAMNMAAADASQKGFDATAQANRFALDRARKGYDAKIGAAENSMYADRARSQAEFAASQDAWDWSNSFATSMSATAASLGGLAGAVEPGQAPVDGMGMAMSGELGARAQGSALFADPGNSNSGFWSGTSGVRSSLESLQQSANSGYKPSDLPTAMHAGAAKVPEVVAQATAGTVGVLMGADRDKLNQYVQDKLKPITEGTKPEERSLTAPSYQGAN